MWKAQSASSHSIAEAARGPPASSPSPAAQAAQNGEGSSREQERSLLRSESSASSLLAAGSLNHSSKSPRIMTQSDSLTSFATPPRDRSPSPYIPERDSTRDELMGVLAAFRDGDPSDLEIKLHLGSQVYRLLIDGSMAMTHVKDDFREAGGFLVIVQMLSSLDQSATIEPASSPDDNDEETHERLRVEIFKLALTIIQEAIHRHPRNLSFFEKSVGWTSFAAALKVSTISQTSPGRFYAGLLGLALADVSSCITKLDSSEDEESEERAERQWTGPIENSGALVTLMVLLEEIGLPQALHLQILSALEKLSKSSRRNQRQMAEVGLGSMLLRAHQIDDNDKSSPLQSLRLRILERVYQLGVSSHDCRSILRGINESVCESYVDLLESVSGPSSLPNMVTFDMKHTSHCSKAMSSLPRSFPPGTSSRGFSFFAPILIDELNPFMPLEIFHLFDARRVCSVKIDIDPSSGHIRYTTSREAPPVLFRNAQIVPGRVYHICVIHTKPAGGNRRTASNAQLYIDGHLVQEESAKWPATPPTGSAMRAVFGSPPTDKSSKEAKTIWSLGPAYLLDDALPPEMPLVIAELAAVGYSGNFQDSLGRLLTYSISTRINLRLDCLARMNGASESVLGQNALVQVVTDAARNIFNEDRFYFILNSANHYELERISKRSTASASLSIANASIDAAQRPGSLVVLNQAVTLTKDAVETSYGYAKLFGSPVLAPCLPLADTIWKLGGCAILLRLIELSRTTSMLEKSLSFAFGLLQRSWRLSEDIERIKGYEVLNYLLKLKKHLVSVKVLQLCCSAVGYTYGSESEAALSNPFLYRIVMLDFDIWAAAGVDVQRAHLAQFVVFLKTSKYRRFNAKRVAKMQITRRLLQTLQMCHGEDMERLCKDVFDDFFSALRITLISSFNDAAIRSISTFLATQLCSSSEDRPSRRANGRSPPRRQQTLADGLPLPAVTDKAKTQHLASPRMEAAIRIFEMLTDLVLERSAFLLKLGSAVNIKWLLIFFGPTSDPRSASMALDIMTALLIKDGRYSDRLARSGGVKVIERLLPRYWNHPRIFSRCWSTLFDIDEQPGNASLYGQFAPKEGHKIVCPLMLRLIVANLGVAMQTVDNKNLKKDPTLRPRPSDFLNVPAKARNTHGRKRSQSMNVDASELVQAFQVTSELALVRDTVRLIEEHAQRSLSFCSLLFSPALMRLLVGAIVPYIDMEENKSDARETTQLANRLLIVIANSAVESITTSASTRVISAIIDSIPPDSDLNTATRFRLALYDRIASAVGNIIIPGLGDVLDDPVRTALSDFIEQCSGEVQNSQALDLTAKMLTSFRSSRPSNAIIAALLTSLDRIILFRLAADSPKIYHEIVEHQEVVFMDANQDIAFFRCLLYNVLSILHRKEVQQLQDVGDDDQEKEGRRMASYNILILLSSARPSLVESIIAPEMTLEDFRDAADVDVAAQLLRGHEDENVPFQAEWEGFTKSRDSLKAAIHLDRMSRVTQSLLSSDEKQRSIKSTETKMMAWQRNVRATEESRLLRIALDAKEMMSFGAGEWEKMMREMQRERAVFGKDTDPERVFELDSTEGPMRMRPKMKEMPRGREDEKEKLPALLQDLSLEEPLMSISHGDQWASGDMSLDGIGEAEEGREKGATEENDKQPPVVVADASLSREEGAAVDTHDDKYRRVIRSLEKGDVIEGVENSLRVIYIECRASLLIFGKKCFYIIDDYFQRPDGELCNLWEAPEEERDSVVMSTLDAEGKGRQTLIEQLEGSTQQTRKWAWAEVKFVALKTFLHRKTAIEIHFKDGQSCLLVLATTEKANNVYRNLATRNKGAAQAFASLTESIREANKNEGGRFSQFAGAVLGKGAGSITQRWVDGKMSNFDYLMCLNTAAGRTYQDITQYPIMPWVLRDYTSERLDLDNPKTFRDLSLPMGAQEAQRRERFEERFRQLRELEDLDPEATKPFHYGTHYSTAATVSGYLIRLRPFDKILRALQGGTFDLADRTFSSIGYAYDSASAGSLGDVRELIPEAYYLPEFLVNSNRFDFGSTQSGIVVDDVELPTWAEGDARLFIKLHREALESDYVSRNLHSWIDLIFGYKQRGEAAVEATNCFHELSYDDAIDLQSLDTSMEQQAVLKTIHMFGVCPRMLFRQPHPQRKTATDSPEELSLTVSPGLMTQSIAPVRTLHAAVHFIYSGTQSRPFASPRDYLILPKLGLSLSIGHLDGSIRFFAKENMGVIRNVVEQIMPDRISAIVDASSSSKEDSNLNQGRILVAGLDGTLTAWLVDGARRDLTFLYACRGHIDVVLCLEYCHAWNLAVSGSQDGTAIIWDSRGRYVKALAHDGPVYNVSISSTTGLIATVSGRRLHLWSINGDPIASTSTTQARESIASLAFLENGDQRDAQQKDTLCTIFTGHRGKMIAWQCERKKKTTGMSSSSSAWNLSVLFEWHHEDDRLNEGAPRRIPPLVTAIRAEQDTITTGDEYGKLFVWSLPGQAVDVPHNISTTCMNCDKKFGLFEKKVNCSACGGLFCAACTDSIGAGRALQQRMTNMRFCDHCRGRVQAHLHSSLSTQEQV